MKSTFHILKYFCLFGIVVVLGGGVAGFALLQSTNDRGHNWVFYDHSGELLWADRPYYVPPSSIPDVLKHRLIAVEDKHFYTHNGVDTRALLRAMKQYVSASGDVSGGSTITMQVTKMLYVKPQAHGVGYKVQQILTALALDTRDTKDTILDVYLRQAYFGQGARGIFEASHRYFQTEPHALNTNQQAALVALLPYPEAWNPITNPAQSHAKKNMVLQKWRDQGLITNAEYAHWSKEKVVLHPAEPHPITAPHFVQWVRGKVQNHHDSLPATVVVHTTLDAPVYRATLGIARDEIEAQQKHNIHDAAVVVLDKNNAVKVMLGGLHFLDDSTTGHLNGTVIRRQTGSVLKPFLYALALQSGMSPATAVHDVSRGFDEGKGVYRPRNFDPDAEYGLTRMREALVNSYNIGAVDVLYRVGNASFLALLQDFGLPRYSEGELGLTSVLGTVEASLLEVTRAYSTLNQGITQPLQAYTRVTDESGKTLFTYSAAEPAPASLSAMSRSWLHHALSDKATRWRVFGQGNILELPFDAAVKTGTSQSFRDNYAVGYTPEFTVGVWVGNSDGQPLYTGSGIAGAGPIWHHVQLQMHTQKSASSFPLPSDRQPVSLCRRPQELYPHCTEFMVEYLTHDEQQNMDMLEDNLKITFPSNGEILAAHEPFLVQTNIFLSSSAQVWLNEEVQESNRLTLSSGEYELWVTEDGARTDRVYFTVQ